MGFKEIMEINPVFITGIGATLIGLGGRDLLISMYNRYCKKEDEKETDHKQIQNIAEKIDCILERLEMMEQADKEGLDNDILILEHNILFLQRKAIKFGKVSKGCMPRYRMLFKRYKALLEKSNLDINEEAETNNEIVERMFHDGEVVDSFWEMYK